MMLKMLMQFSRKFIIDSSDEVDDSSESLKKEKKVPILDKKSLDVLDNQESLGGKKNANRSRKSKRKNIKTRRRKFNTNKKRRI